MECSALMATMGVSGTITGMVRTSRVGPFMMSEIRAQSMIKEGIDRKRYNRIAGIYDSLESPMELLSYSRWRMETFNWIPKKGRILACMNPLVVNTFGPNINRLTVENIRNAGFDTLDKRYLLSSVFRIIVAKSARDYARARM